MDKVRYMVQDGKMCTKKSIGIRWERVLKDRGHSGGRHKMDGGGCKKMIIVWGWLYGKGRCWGCRRWVIEWVGCMGMVVAGAA